MNYDFFRQYGKIQEGTGTLFGEKKGDEKT